jgi:hypothetical protein
LFQEERQNKKKREKERMNKWMNERKIAQWEDGRYTLSPYSYGTLLFPPGSYR